MKTNCFHIRNSSGEKLVGGMTHCTSYEQAAEHASAELTVKVDTSGNAQFFRNGKPVDVYISVHPEHTKKGQEALKKYWDEYYLNL